MTRRILASYLLPPGVFVTLVAAAGLWHFLKKRRLAAAIHLVLGALLWGLSIAPGADLLTRGLEAPYRSAGEPRGDVIVLLGGGVYGRAPDLTGIGAPSDEAWVRIGTAARLQRKLGVPVIVSGGKVFPGKPAEAPIVKRILVDLGVPAGRVVTEELSRDTRENASYTAEIAKRARFRKPVLVTSAYHMRRAIIEFRRVGLAATPCPAGFRTWPGREYGPEDFLPDPASLRRSSAAVREYAALLAQSLGTFLDRSSAKEREGPGTSLSSMSSRTSPGFVPGLFYARRPPRYASLIFGSFMRSADFPAWTIRPVSRT